MYNTAVLRLFPGSSVARRILDGAKARQLQIMERKRLEKNDEADESLRANHQDSKEAEARSSDRPVSLLELRKEQKKRLLNKRGEMSPDEIYHPARLRYYLSPEDGELEGNGLLMFPPAFFDPLWLRRDSKETVKSTDTDKMVEDLRLFSNAFLGNASAVCPKAAPANLKADTDETMVRIGDDDMEKGSNQDFTAGPEVFFTGAYAYHWHNNWLTPIEPQSWMGLMRQAYDDFVAGQRPNLYGEWFS
jgi:hypothetical protein